MKCIFMCICSTCSLKNCVSVAPAVKQSRLIFLTNDTSTGGHLEVKHRMCVCA